MKLTLCIVAVGCGLVLALGAAPLLADWHWIGAGADNDFSTDANWFDDDLEENRAPDDSQPIYFTVPTTGYSSCAFDADYDWDYPGPTTITGTSPTWFEFRISGQPWTPYCCDPAVPTKLTLNDYSKLVIDDVSSTEPDVLTGSTDLTGNVWISLASGVECDLNGTDVLEENSILKVVTGGTSYVEMESLLISSQGHGEHINFKLIGGGKIKVVATGAGGNGRTCVEGVYDENDTAYPAAFWVADADFSTDTLSLIGGSSNDRRVSLDIDEDVTVATSTDVGHLSDDEEIWIGGGTVNVDVADNTTMNVGDALTVYGPTAFKVTGSTGASGGRLQTSGQ